MCLEVNAHWLETNKWYIINILCIHALTLYSYKSRNPLYKIFRKLLNYLIFFEFRANSRLLPILNTIIVSLWILSLWSSNVKYIRRKCVFFKIFSESRNIKNINSVNVKNNNGIKISYTKIFNFFFENTVDFLLRKLQNNWYVYKEGMKLKVVKNTFV